MTKNKYSNSNLTISIDFILIYRAKKGVAKFQKLYLRDL